MGSLKVDGSKITGAVDFVISRKRKLYKFARFNEMGNCFQLEEWREFLGGREEEFRRRGVVAEVGAGSALFLVEQAKLEPEKVFVAVDVKSDRLYRGARAAEEAKLSNIYFVRSRVEELEQVFSRGMAEEIWLTFSDPYPRKSDARHRLTYARYLGIYGEVLAAAGELHFKTDSREFFDYSVESFVDNGWEVTERSYDLHWSELPESYRVMTSYEARFVGEGKRICFLTAKPLVVQKKLT